MKSSMGKCYGRKSPTRHARRSSADRASNARKHVFRVNYQFIVADVNEDMHTLINTLSVSLQMARNSFGHNYCKA